MNTLNKSLGLRKLDFPKIAVFGDFPSYLKSLLEINQKKGRPVSLGYLARKLGWSKSLLKDYALGRRRLTLHRAFAFSKFAEMNIWERERICKMALEFPPHPATPIELHIENITPQRSRPLTQNSSLRISDKKANENFGDTHKATLLFLTHHEHRILKSKISDIARFIEHLRVKSHEQMPVPSTQILVDISVLSLLSPPKQINREDAQVLPESIPTHSPMTAP